MSTISQPLWWAPTTIQSVLLCFHTALFSFHFCLKFYLPFLQNHCMKYPQINLPLSADIMLICNMLAGGCAARRSELPAVCLHFSQFNVGSLVCEAQLHGLVVNQSIPCEHTCPNKCRLVIFYPNCPRVVRERVNAPTVGHTRAISLDDRWRNPGRGVRAETSQTLHHYRRLSQICFSMAALAAFRFSLMLRGRAQAGILPAVGLKHFLCAFFFFL